MAAKEMNIIDFKISRTREALLMHAMVSIVCLVSNVIMRMLVVPLKVDQH